MSDFQELAESVIAGDQEQVQELTKALIANGTDPLVIINDGLIAGMNVVGKRFKANEMYVPEVLMSARAMANGVAIVKPLLGAENASSKGKILIGTVQGDLHDIGKNLVIMLLESNGYEVIDLGIDLRPEVFVDAVKEHQPQVLGMSALLTTTMMNMKKTIDLLAEEGLRDSVKVIVGGAPVSQSFADDITADGYAADAASTVDLVAELIS